MTTTDVNRWKGKVAFVTGANGGIGMAITKRLLDLDLAVVAIDKQTDLLLVSTYVVRRSRSLRMGNVYNKPVKCVCGNHY